MFIIKDIIRSKKYKEQKNLIKSLRREILAKKCPKMKDVPRIKQIEYNAMKLGIPLYRISVKIFDLFKKGN